MVVQPKEVAASPHYEAHLGEFLEYSLDVFGYVQTCKYFNRISQCVERLHTLYDIYPECRHLATKSRMYRDIILDAHLIIYRITPVRIEVLDIVHGASSIGKIRRVRKIQL
jgi:plasmid stabilization system protein ParE